MHYTFGSFPGLSMHSLVLACCLSTSRAFATLLASEKPRSTTCMLESCCCFTIVSIDVLSHRIMHALVIYYLQFYELVELAVSQAEHLVAQRMYMYKKSDGWMLWQEVHVNVSTWCK